jgi:hypothetical protein
MIMIPATTAVKIRNNFALLICLSDMLTPIVFLLTGQAQL